MLRIGEFSVLSSISIHMLRNYDKIGLLSPVMVDEESGYRYYDKQQLVQANQIVALKSMGFGLEEIKEILLEGQSKIEEILSAKLQEKYNELTKINEQINQIKVIMETEKESEDYARSIVRKTIPSMKIASYRGQIHTYPEEGMLWGKLDTMCKQANIKVSKAATAMAMYYGTDEATGLLDVEVQFPLSAEQKELNVDFIRSIPKREVVSIVFKGSYSQISKINRVVAEWLEKNKLEINGQIFSIYLNSPGNGANDKEFITELCFPVKEK